MRSLIHFLIGRGTQVERRTYQYGYHYDEVELPEPGSVDPSFKLIDGYEFTSGKTRLPMAASLGTHYLGANCPLPQTTQAGGAVHGVLKRIACLMPDVDHDLYIEFVNYSIKIINEEFQHCVVSPNDDISVETWLKNAPYTKKRKEMLQKISEKRSSPLPGDYIVKFHVKHEPYLTWKYFRGIYSRSDYFKTVIGPVLALIGDNLFKHKAFIKKIPVHLRPQAIIDRFSIPGIKMAANDFTAFESMFRPLQMVIEVYFFFFCTCNLPIGLIFLDMMKKIKMGKNMLSCKLWSAFLTAKRYSGEMDTSSMNGLFNYLLIRFLNMKSGETHTIPPFIEGDDSLNAFFGKLDESILVRLGAKAKLEYFEDVFSASFCGMVFNSDSKQIITNPIKAILTFGYSNQFYLKSNDYKLDCLLRAKSLSMLYTYPGCPVLTKLAEYGLRVSRQCSDRDMFKYYCRQDPYLIEKFKHVITSKPVSQQPTTQTRLLFEQLYHITVDSQLSIESYLDSLLTKQPLRHECIDNLLTAEQILCYDKYTHLVPVANNHYL